MWHPGSGLVLDCIDSISLPSFLLLFRESSQNGEITPFTHVGKSCSSLEFKTSQTYNLAVFEKIIITNISELTVSLLYADSECSGL